MVNIRIKLDREGADGWIFNVEVEQSGEKTIHIVEVSKYDYERLTGGKVTPEELVKTSFRFLLEREPKESILSKFNLIEIGKYFSEYEQEISNY